jgi:hypothetical protein
MTTLTSLQIDMIPSSQTDGCAEVHFRARVGFDNGITKIMDLRQVFDTDDFTPMWERMMDRAKEDIKAAVRIVQEDLK